MLVTVYSHLHAPPSHAQPWAGQAGGAGPKLSSSSVLPLALRGCAGPSSVLFPAQSTCPSRHCGSILAYDCWKVPWSHVATTGPSWPRAGGRAGRSCATDPGEQRHAGLCASGHCRRWHRFSSAAPGLWQPCGPACERVPT